MSLSIQPPYPVVNDTDGQPLENGYIWIGTANLNPQTNPISIYWDAALTQPAAQPVRTQGGYPSNAGNPGRLYAATNYSILVQNSRGVTLYSAPQQTELYGTASGGTGLTSYVVGDLLYADGTASLARLADVATGNVLRSGGVATAPAWGKVGLTTDVTGVLPAANGGTGGVLPAANGGTGLSAPGTSGNVLSSDGTTWQSVAVSTLVPDATDSVKGVVELATDAEVQAGTDTTRAITPDALRKGALVLGTAQASTSGTAIDFTSIPSWVKRIIILFNNVSLSGTDNILVQIGDSGGFETSNYESTSSGISSAVSTVSSSNGFIVYVAVGLRTLSGRIVIENLEANLWISSHTLSGFYATISTHVGGGKKDLSDVLDRVRVTRTGTDTFDVGSINIMYE